MHVSRFSMVIISAHICVKNVESESKMPSEVLCESSGFRLMFEYTVTSSVGFLAPLLASVDMWLKYELLIDAII